MYFEQNLKIITERWPDSADQLRNTGDPEQVELIRNTPETTLMVNGIHLSSCFDRLREARIQAELIPDESTHTHVYGLAAGDLPRVLLPRPQLKHLTLVLMNLQVARASLAYFDHSDWLADPRVNLLAAEPASDLQFPFACAPAYLYLADDQSARLRDLLQLELATPYIRQKHSQQQIELLKKIEENKTFWSKDSGVADAPWQLKDRQVVVASGGATLADNFDWLRERRADYFLIGVDAAIQPLFNHGIMPDVVVSIDSHFGLFKLFYSQLELGKFNSTNLVYFPQVPTSLLTQWTGLRFLAYSNHGLYQEVENQRPGNRLFVSGSVIHAAIDLAVKKGAQRIALCGADFAFTKGVSRIDELGQERSKPIRKDHWLLNGRGERVWTGVAYRGYLRDLERYIAWHNKIDFINCSDEGALIKGARIITDGGLWTK